MDLFMTDMASRAGGSAIAKVGASVIEKLAGKAADVIKDRLAQVDLWSEYERRYIDRYGKVELLLSGMREAVPLKKIYTGIRFLDRLSIGQFASVEALEKGFREKSRRFGQQDRLQRDGMAVANEHSLLMLLGGPGAGKSTYLRRVGLEALTVKGSQFRHEVIPVMLELKQFNGEQIDIKAAIVKEFSHVGLDFSVEFVEEALQQGKLLVLLDGLDEVPNANQDRVFQSIQDFVSRYNKTHQGNRFIASCRIAAFTSGFTGFKNIELADFDSAQIQRFIDNWFHGELDQKSHTAEKCWNLLNNEGYQSAKELAQTPLLLTYLCVVYDRTQSFPPNRAALYRKVLDILLEEWAAEKRIRYEPIYEGLNTELEKVLLAEIAYQGFVKDQLFFTREELISHIQKFLEDSADKPKYLDGKAVLTAIAVQQGILAERAEGIYSFSHLTIQEYLVAQYLSQNPVTLIQKVEQYLTQQRWREIFLLVPGLIPKADNLLKRMETIAQQEICTPKLQALLTWADSVTVIPEHSASASVRRLLALSFSLALILAHDYDRTRALNHVQDRTQELALILDRDLAQSLALDRTLAFDHTRALNRMINRALDRAFDLDRAHIFNSSVNLSGLVQELKALQAQVPKDNELLEVRRDFTEQLLQVWFKGLGVNRTLLKIPTSEIQALSSYFYIYKLIIQCKESAVRVTHEVWEAIEKDMLMPKPGNEL
jgi:predicted NACHT family NTPase